MSRLAFRLPVVAPPAPYRLSTLAMSTIAPPLKTFPSRAHNSVARLCARGLLAIALPLVLGSSGCKGGNPPVIQDIPNTEALVGQTLTITVIATDKDPGDKLTFRFEAPNVPDIGTTAAMTTGPDGHGLFTFTPVASQLGPRLFDFYASDGKHEDVYTVEITVRGAVGSGSAPTFHQPMGPGIALAFAAGDSLSVPIELGDPDSTDLTLAVVPPTLEASELSAASNGFTGTWFWEPTREQTPKATNRFEVTFSADDGDNPPTLKRFQVVLRKNGAGACAGDPPKVEHQPEDKATLQDLRITARITDDAGLDGPPYVLYATVDPGDPVDYKAMVLTEMELDSGDTRDGTWTGVVPNPVASGPEGSQGTLYYLISASDEECTADTPATGTHAITITNQPGEAGGLCDPCSADVQCGGASDLCIAHPDGNFCGKFCQESTDCSGDSVCSAEPIGSVEGVTARQCIPNSGTCEGGGGTCDDDGSEPNQAPDAATPLAAGSHDFTVCPGNSDWFRIDLNETASIEAWLEGDDPPDIDLQLTDAAGVLIEASLNGGSSEDLTSACLDPGSYRLLVDSIGAESGDYTVGYALNTDCGTPSADCCTVQGAGCLDTTIESCVCSYDSFCCTTAWDAECVELVGTTLCEIACIPDDFDGPCCETHGPGCEIDSIEECVCAEDPDCCMSGWDSWCVDGIAQYGCGAYGAGC